MTLKRNTTPVIAASDPAITTNTLQSPFESVGNGLRSAQTGNTPPVRCALVNTNSSVYSECGSVYQTCINRSTTNQYVQCSISTLNVGLTNSSNIYCNVLPGIERLAFDTDSGFDVTDIGNATAKIGMNSTFKCWNVNGNPGLVAVGLDTVNFIAGSGINITSDNTLVPKTFTISSTGGGGGTPGGCNTQVQFNNSGSFSGDTGLTYNCSTKTVGLCNISTSNNTDISVTTNNTLFTWYASYGDKPADTEDNYSSSAAYDSMGNLVFVGGDSTYSIVFVAKYDSLGNLLWQKQITHPVDMESGDSIVIDSQDNIYLGVTISPQIGLLKLDSSGNLLWQKEFTLSNDTPIWSMAVDQADNVILSFAGTEYTSNEVRLAKIDENGIIIWANNYEITGATNSGARGVTCDNSNNIYVIVNIESESETGLLKLNNSGVVQFFKKYNFDIASSLSTGYVAVDSTGNIYLAGADQFESTGFILKTDSVGNILWQKNYDSFESYVHGLVLDSNDNVYWSLVVSDNTWCFVTIKLDSSGTILWQRKFDGNFDEYNWYYYTANSITAFGNYYSINGYSYSTHPTGNSSEAIIGQFAQDGSGTGSYGNFIYSEVNLTFNSTVFTSTSGAATSSILTYTMIPGTMIVAGASLTSTTTEMTGGLNTFKFNKDGTFTIGNYDLPKNLGPNSNALTSLNGVLGWASVIPTLDCNANLIVNTTSPTLCYGSGGTNIAIGHNSLVCSCGYNNIALGCEVLRYNTTGGDNIGIGYGALLSTTVGFGNTAVGERTLQANTTGQNNVALGSYALCRNTTGLSNIAIGVRAASCLLTGSNNIAIGNFSLCSNVSGNNNIAIGNCSGGWGNCNINIGDDTGWYGTIGLQATEFSIAIGQCSGLRQGQKNITIGKRAGRSSLNWTSANGCNNIVLGNDAFDPFGFSSCNNNNIVIGSEAAPLGSICCSQYNMFIGNNSGLCICGTNLCGAVHIGQGKFLPIPWVGPTVCADSFVPCSNVLHISSGVPSCCFSRLVIDNTGAWINAGSPATSCQNRAVNASYIGLIGAVNEAPSSPITLNLNESSILFLSNLSSNFSLFIDERSQLFITGGVGGGVFEFKVVIKQGATPYTITNLSFNAGFSYKSIQWLNGSPPTPVANSNNVFTFTYYGKPYNPPASESFVAGKLEVYL